MQTIKVEDLQKVAKDVTLLNGAKHRCIDATVIYELPKVNLVQCKECRHWDRIYITNEGCCHDHMIDRITNENDFCSHGDIVGENIPLADHDELWMEREGEDRC